MLGPAETDHLLLHSEESAGYQNGHCLCEFRGQELCGKHLLLLQKVHDLAQGMCAVRPRREQVCRPGIRARFHREWLPGLKDIVVYCPPFAGELMRYAEGHFRVGLDSLVEKALNTAGLPDRRLEIEEPEQRVDRCIGLSLPANRERIPLFQSCAAPAERRRSCWSLSVHGTAFGRDFRSSDGFSV